MRKRRGTQLFFANSNGPSVTRYYQCRDKVELALKATCHVGSYPNSRNSPGDPEPNCVGLSRACGCFMRRLIAYRLCRRATSCLNGLNGERHRYPESPECGPHPFENRVGEHGSRNRMAIALSWEERHLNPNSNGEPRWILAYWWARILRFR